jgi:hypothetical protein
MELFFQAPISIKIALAISLWLMANLFLVLPLFGLSGDRCLDDLSGEKTSQKVLATIEDAKRIRRLPPQETRKVWE